MADRAERVRSILSIKGLTLAKVSQKSGALYGRSSRYFLPHNLYYDLRIGTFSPSVYQVFALSRISGYRLYDWLRVFGFAFEDIPRLQVQLPSNRTVLLDRSLDDPSSWVSWFRSRTGTLPAPPTAPLAQFLELGTPRRLRSLAKISNGGFLYAKIGKHDALAFPELLPGSIVRVNPRLTGKLALLPGGETSGQLFLIEHGRGFCCCRLRLLGDNRVMPVSTQLPYRQIELELPNQAILRGVADLEIRSLLRVEQPDFPRQWASSSGTEPIAPPAKLSRLLRGARMRMNLSFREASVVSRHIADLLGDEQHFISPSSLSDYEACDDAPRHLQKVITLCALYAIDVSTFLTTAGIELEEGGTDSIPDQLMPGSVAVGIDAGEGETGNSDPTGFLQQLIDKCEEVPFFLRVSRRGFPDFGAQSLRDIFWIGGERNALHTYLMNGVLIAVNRRKKKPRCDASKPTWQQSLYLLRKRDGAYLSGCCGLENGSLVIHSSPQPFHHPKRLQHPYDAQVVGQIVTIVRKLP